MTKKKIAISATVSAAIAAAVITFNNSNNSNKKGGPKKDWPACVFPLSAAGVKNGNGWSATVKLNPTNAPCYTDITAEAVDSRGNKGTSSPTRIYITK